MVMTTTVLALFNERRQAETAIVALQSAHFDLVRIGLAEPDEVGGPGYGWFDLAGVLAGAAGCGFIGVVIGMFAGGFLPFLPAWLPGGWFVPFLLGVAGAGTGAVAGLLMSQPAGERGEHHDDREVQASRTLVTVHAQPGDVDAARRILLEQGAFDAAPIEAPIRKAS
jgi:hypothetical protein